LDPPTEPPLASYTEERQERFAAPPPFVDLIRPSYAKGRILGCVFEPEDGVVDAYGARYEREGYGVSGLPPSLYKSLLLPTKLKQPRSVKQLFDSVHALFQQHVMLSEKQSILLSYWSIASWFADILPLFHASRLLDQPLRPIYCFECWGVFAADHCCWPE
jgi:hypothetical protein